ncbi:Ltp family lipoprotein [Oceanobacillus profundus]|uniref:Ltp family lipoprotein n=1 Tax=Oceanobacillus profundus TaxID=372463 RepID=UPI00203D8D65|nr:Ltp family lipoprotein [Oceanobacillus profundus]MCM3396801.1 Ltp family lipoprotein [Oceanobacillus profundus]
MKKLSILLLSLLVAITLAACGETEPETEDAADQEEAEVEEVVAETDKEESVENVDATETVEEETETEVEEAEVEEVAPADDVSREHQNALKAAQNYIDMMGFSEKGLFEQLTSEYGDQYPEDAAQYAIENVEVDYNEEALESAESYQELMPMSDQELLDQLTSEYGDQYTEEQAQYALDNLPN